MIKVSVIVPVYNAEQSLKRCVDSILAQSEKEIEIILVDDGSSDGSFSICKKLQESDQRISAIHKKNGGPHSARKMGVALAKAFFVTFVDADDWIEPKLIENLLQAQSSSNADMVVFGYSCEVNSEILKIKNDIVSGIYNRESLIQNVFPVMLCPNNSFKQNIIPALYAKIYERTVLEAIMNKVDESICLGEDLACTISYLLHSKRIIICNEYTQYHYCIHSNTVSSRFDSEYYKKSLKLMIFLETLVNEQNMTYLMPNINRYELYLIYRHIGIMLLANDKNEFKLFLEYICEAVNTKEISNVLNKNNIKSLQLSRIDKLLLMFLKNHKILPFKIICEVRFIRNRYRKVL